MNFSAGNGHGVQSHRRAAIGGGQPRRHLCFWRKRWPGRRRRHCPGHRRRDAGYFRALSCWIVILAAGRNVPSFERSYRIRSMPISTIAKQVNGRRGAVDAPIQERRDKSVQTKSARRAPMGHTSAHFVTSDQIVSAVALRPSPKAKRQQPPDESDKESHCLGLCVGAIKVSRN